MLNEPKHICYQSSGPRIDTDLQPTYFPYPPPTCYPQNRQICTGRSWKPLYLKPHTVRVSVMWASLALSVGPRQHPPPSSPSSVNSHLLMATGHLRYLLNQTWIKLINTILYSFLFFRHRCDAGDALPRPITCTPESPDERLKVLIKKKKNGVLIINSSCWVRSLHV